MDPVRARIGFLLFIGILMVSLPKINSFTCIENSFERCDKSKCEPLTDCKFGTTFGLCGCCDRCAKGPGESCGGTWGNLGYCSRDLKLGCSQTRKSGIPGVCVPEDEAAELYG